MQSQKRKNFLVAFFLQDSPRFIEKLLYLNQEGEMCIALKLIFAKDDFIKLTASYKKDQNSCCEIRYSPDTETQH